MVKELTLLLLIAIVCFGQKFIHQPEDETVFSGTAAHFVCGTRGSATSPTWRLNGKMDLPPDVSINETTNSRFGLHYTRLSIPGVSNYNRTKVQCLSGEGDGSNIASMYLQGTLSHVVNVRVQKDDERVTIFWAAPFSLDVSHVEYDIWYWVHVYDKTQQRKLNCTNCVDIYDTNYIFTPEQEDQCHEYTFTIVPLNGAGEGERYYLAYHNSSVDCNDSHPPVPPGGDDKSPEEENIALPVAVGVSVVVAVVLVTGTVVVGCLLMKERRKTGDAGAQENGGQHVDTSRDIQLYRMQQGQLAEGVLVEEERSEEKENVEEEVPKEKKKDVSEKTESPSVVVVQFTPEEREDPFKESETERGGNSQPQSSAGQQVDEQESGKVCFVTNHGQFIPSNHLSTDIASTATPTASTATAVTSSESGESTDDCGPEATVAGGIHTTPQKHDKVVAADEGSAEPSECVVNKTDDKTVRRIGRTTQKSRSHHTIKEEPQGMTHPYQDSPIDS